MTPSFENLLGILVLIAVPLAFVFYGKLVQHLWRNGGHTRTDWVGLPDLPMALIVGGSLAGLAIQGLMQADKAPAEMKPDQLVPGMIFLMVLAGGITIFLAMRRLKITSIFGLGVVSPPRAFGRGFLLLLAAVPIVITFSLLTVFFLKDKAQEQELVKLFSDVSQKGDINTVIQIVLAGVIVAPICEELLFRGYFYPVAKRYLGSGVGAFLTAALFAASHVNLTSLPGLLALALCFTIAYESAGSLLVPISMHALFNGTNLLILYLNAQSRL